MLYEDQVAELLRRCESLTGKRFASVRGNLREASSRAASVWELVCIEALAQHWSIGCEPDHGSKPDVVAVDADGREIWFEISFLYPRDWKGERQRHDLSTWIYARANELKIPLHKVSVHYHLSSDSSKGGVLNLPEQHEKRKVLRSSELTAFFSQVVANPKESVTTLLAPYSVKIKYDPSDNGPYVHGSGVVVEQPTEIGQHALYLKLSEKARQHDPVVPYVICVGSDQSPVLSSWGAYRPVQERDVVAAIFKSFSRVSGVLLVSIETELPIDRSHLRKAHSRLYVNASARNPLNERSVERIKAVDFNRWRYTFQLDKNGIHGAHKFFRSGGSLLVTMRGDNMKITIPSTVVVDCLAGRTTLAKEYRSSPTDNLLSCIDDGWDVVACDVSPGNLQQGQASQITFELTPPPDRVFRE